MMMMMMMMMNDDDDNLDYLENGDGEIMQGDFSYVLG